MWLEQITAWFNSAYNSGMLALGGISLGGIFTSAKAWLGNIGLNTKITSLEATVLTQEQLIKDTNDRVRQLESLLSIVLKGQEANFIATNKLAQATTISPTVKNELIELATTTLPLFKTQAEIVQQVNQLGASITQPITQAQALVEQQKLDLQKQASAKIEAGQDILKDTFAKVGNMAKETVDSLSKTILGDKQA